MKQAERIEAARAYLAKRKRTKRIDALSFGYRFGLTYREAQKLVYAAQLERAEITLADLPPDMRRALVDPANLNLHAIAAGPIMDSNALYLPAGKISLAEAKAREQAAILEARHA